MTERSRTLMGVMYALVVAGYPLISALPLILQVNSRVISVPYRGLVLIYSVAIICWLGVRFGRLYRGIFWIPFIAFWVMYTIRLLLDVIFVPAPIRISGPEYFAYALGMCLVTAIALFIRVDRPTLEKGLRYTFALAVVACVIALYVNVAAILAGDLESLQNMRMSSETLSPISLGNLGVTVCILSLFMMLRRERPRVWSMVGLILLLVVGIATTAMAASRQPILALALALPVLVWLGMRQGAGARAWLLGGAVIVGGIAGGIYVEYTLGFGTISRIQSVIAFQGDNSAMTRVTLFTDAWDQFLSHPFFGNHLEEMNSSFHPHNPLVESFMAAGFLAGTAFTLMLAVSIFAAMKLLVRLPSQGWLPILYGQYLLHALVSGALFLSVDMWALMTGIIACAYGGTVLPRVAAQPAPERGHLAVAST